MAQAQELSAETVSRLIGEIHEAALSDERWPTVLQQIGGVVGAPSVGLWKQTGAAFHDVHKWDQSLRPTNEYFQHFHRLDRLLPAVMRAPTRTILSNEMVVDRAEFEKGEFYTDFVRKHRLRDCIHARVFVAGHYSSYFSMTTPEIAGPTEFRLVSLLLPHLGHAVKAAQQLSDLRVKHDAAVEALDVIRDAAFIVDGQGRLLHANRVAEALLRRRGPLVVDRNGSRLSARTAKGTTALHRVIRQSAEIGGGAVEEEAPFSGTLRLDCADLGPVLLRAVPLRARAAWNPVPRAAVLLLVTVLADRSAAPLVPQLRSLFGLTPAEASVAGHIGQGKGVNVAAEEMRITPSTLRWHLQRVFSKTGTSRQSELTRLVERLGSVGARDDPDRQAGPG